MAGDRIGRRWSLAIGTVIFSAATMGASLADDVWQMSAWRLVSGLGFGEPTPLQSRSPATGCPNAGARSV